MMRLRIGRVPKIASALCFGILMAACSAAPGATLAPQPSNSATVSAPVDGETAVPTSPQSRPPQLETGQPSSAAQSLAHVATPEPVQQSPAPISTAAISEADRRISDMFWSTVTDYGHYGYVYDSLDEMIGDSHLVVRGSLVGFSTGIRYPFGSDFGASIGPWTETFGTVRVLEVLKGQPVWRTFGQIEVVALGWPDMSEDDLPSGEVLLFLKNDSQWREEMSVDPNPDSDTQFHYVRANPYQTALRDIDGVIDLIDGPKGWQDAFGPFPSELDGILYADTVETIRLMVASGSG